MTINDPIADMLTRIRNAGMARRSETSMPSAKILVAIEEILKREGYIRGYRVEERQPYPILTIELKYGSDRRHTIRALKRVSRPGLRVYSKKDTLPRVQSGLGIAVVSTPQGLLTDHEARRRGVGGEVLCTVW
jgi:small subunit ribosomal protein S8